MLYVDNREIRSGVPRFLTNLLSKTDMKIQLLKSADYAFGDIGIERKCISDLYHTLFMKKKEGGRLWRQLGVLKDTYKKPYLLVEGTIDWSEPVLAGVLNSLLLFSPIKVIFTSNERQTAIQISKMYKKYGSDRSGTPPPPAVIHGSTPKQVRWAMLQCIRKIGPNGANKILEAIPDLFEHNDQDVRMIRSKLDQIKNLPKESKDMLIQVFTK